MFGVPVPLQYVRTFTCGIRQYSPERASMSSFSCSWAPNSRHGFVVFALALHCEGLLDKTMKIFCTNRGVPDPHALEYSPGYIHHDHCSPPACLPSRLRPILCAATHVVLVSYDRERLRSRGQPEIIPYAKGSIVQKPRMT